MLLDKQEIMTLFEASLDQVLKGRECDEIELPEEMRTDKELRSLFEKVNELLQSVSGMNRFAMELCQGNLDVETPGRRNYLAAYLKELHAQLSGLCWGMEQLVEGRMVSKLYYSGRMFDAFNRLVEKIAAASSGIEGEDTWGWSENSWRYHQILAALNNLRIMVLEVAEDGKIVYANRPAKEYLGELKYINEDDTVNDSAMKRHLAQCSNSESVFPIFREVYDEKDGSWYKITSDKVKFIDGKMGYLHMVDDISEWKKHESSLKMTATTDFLTGTYNRHVGMKALEEALLAPARDTSYCAAFIDVDGLKGINDIHGHNEGDYAIKSIANILMSSVREEDIVSRYGGDEFLVIFHNCNKEKAEKIFNRMLDKLEAINNKAVNPYKLSFSYGIVDIGVENEKSMTDVVAQMDQIMYHNKRNKKWKIS